MIDDFDDVLAAARRGHAEALTAIWTDLVGPVAAYVRGKGVADPEDTTSEVFVAVLTGLDRFRGRQGQFRSWVFTIAHRRVVDEWRRAGRQAPTVPLEDEPDVDRRRAPSAEAEALGRLGEDAVRAYLDRLTDDQRDVLLLRVVADLTVEQVAEVLSRSPGAVKALQRRGLASVRRLLVQEGVTL